MSAPPCHPGSGRRAAALGALALAAACALLSPIVAGEDAARQAAAVVGTALQKGDASLLRPVLPARGKVQLRLVRLGPEDGSFSAGQVEALLGDFLREGRIRRFEIVRVAPDPAGLVLVLARAAGTDRAGRPTAIDLHLAFETEDDRWVLRELREALP